MEPDEKLLPAAFRTTMTECMRTSNLEEIKLSCRDKLIHSLENFESTGSGWIFVTWSKLTVKIVKWKPTSASSYQPTPKNLKYLKCLLNIRNKDNMCFLYCVVASYPEFLPKKNRTYPGQYRKHFSQFNTKGMLKFRKGLLTKQ